MTERKKIIEKHDCNNCELDVDMEFRYQEGNQRAYVCQKCGSYNYISIEKKNVQVPVFNEDGFDEDYKDVCLECNNKLSTGNYEVYCINEECKLYDKNIYISTEDEIRQAITNKFSKLYFEDLSEDEFWSYVKNWFNVDTILDIMKNWDYETQKEAVESIDDVKKCYWLKQESIIENYINYFTSDDKEREQMKLSLKDYLEAEKGL